MAAQWPLVVQQLLTTLPGLSGWGAVTVYDGPPVTEDNPPDYCIVGWDQTSAAGGDYRQSPDPDGFQLVEIGNVHGWIVCRTGDPAALPALRTRLFAYLDAFETWIRTPTGQRLGGVLSGRSTVDLSVQVTPVQETVGTAVGALWTLSYDTAS